MKPVLRPLAAAGVTFSIGLLLFSFCGYEELLLLTAICGAVCGSAAILVLMRKIRQAGIIVGLLFFAAAAAVSLTGRAELLKRVSGWAGTEVSVSGKIEAVWAGDAASYLICAEKGELDPGTRVLVYTGSAAEFALGERVSLDAELSEDAPTRSQMGKGADLVCYVPSGNLRLVQEAGGWAKWTGQLREMLRQRLYRNLSKDSAAFFEAVLLGNEEALSPDVYQIFSDTGTSHLLCISGLHISMIMCFFGWLFRRFPGGKPGFFLTLLAGGAFVLFTGAAAASVRAWVMASFALSAAGFCRDYSPSNSLGGAMLLLCLVDPRVVYQTGFWLSVIATAAMFGAAPRLTEKFCSCLPVKAGENRFVRKAAGILCCTVAVNLCCLPVFVLWYGSIPLFSPLANLLILPIFPFLMAGGMLCMLGSFMYPLGTVLSKILEGFFWLLEKLASIPGGYLPLGLPWLGVWAAFSGVLLLIGLFNNRKHLALSVSLSAILLTAGAGSWTVSRRNVLTISWVLTDQGGSIVLHTDGCAVLIGCGGDSMIGGKTAAYLKSVGIHQLDAVVIPEETRRCMSGVEDLSRRFAVDTLYSEEESNWYQTALDSPNIESCLYLEAGEYLLFDRFPMELVRVENFVRIRVTAAERSILFLSKDDPGVEKISMGADAVFFYDEIPEKDGIPSAEYAIINRKQSWLDGFGEFGEHYAASGYLNIAPDGEMSGRGL